MQEVWKDIKGYEGLYQISTLGQYRSCDRYILCKNRWGQSMYVFHKGKCMKQYVNNKGYYTARLYKNGSQKTYLIHRLVAETFIPNPNNLPEVNHKDEKKNNNCVDNLHWCTKVFNNGYGKLDKYGRRKSRRHIMKKVAQYDLNGSLLNVYDGLLLAKERTGINNNCISRCCSGKLKTSGGYIWKYVDENSNVEVSVK